MALAVAAPALRGSAASPAGLALLVLALWQLGWGLWALGARQAPAPRAALAVCAAGAAGWVLALALGVEGTARMVGTGVGVRAWSAAPAAVLCAAVPVLVLLARHGRRTGGRAADRTGAAAAAGPGPRGGWAAPLVGLGLAALAVSALVTPALAATPSGDAPSVHDHRPATNPPGGTGPATGDGDPGAGHGAHG